jgi:hypothetical protein
MHDLHSSPSDIWVIISRRIDGAGHVVCMGRGEVYTLVLKLVRKLPLGRSRVRWKNSIIVGSQEIGKGR